MKEHKAVSLGALIKKMTSQPATFVGLTDRGSILAQNWADIVVMDWDNFASKADFAHPHESPEGIKHALVNGQLAVSEGKVTGARGGRGRGRNEAPDPP